MKGTDILSKVDHTLLKAAASWPEIQAICDEAIRYGTASVCIPPSYIKRIADTYGEAINICTVIGFPLGATLSDVKAFEAKRCIELGANEVDMVINIGAAKDGDWQLVESDIKAVVDAAKGRALVKVIIETCLLTDEEKKLACECAMRAGADFVKTSTGFSTGGATEHDVALMRSVVGDSMGVKASGGVRTPEDAERFIKAGASRLGTSNGVKLLG